MSCDTLRKGCARCTGARCPELRGSRPAQRRYEDVRRARRAHCCEPLHRARTLATMQPSGNDDPPQTPEFNRQLFTSLVQGTRQSNALPGEHEHAAYSASMAGLGDRLTTMMTGFMPPGDESEFDRVRNLTDRALEQVAALHDAHRWVL